MTDHSSEFVAIAEEARELAGREVELDKAALGALEKAAEEVARSWSKSSLGYQANVYYKAFRVPPPGAMFSREWGFQGRFQGTVGDWQPYEPAQVVAHVEKLAGNPQLGPSRTASEAVRPAVESMIERARSLAARIPLPYDAYLAENLQELQKVAMPTVDTLAATLRHTTSGQFPVRDMQAAEGGWQSSGHHVVLANVMHIRVPYSAAKWLAEVCEKLGQHLEAVESGAGTSVIQLGSKIFIGHGGSSKEYLDLGVWLTDLGFEWEVFDRKPTAGLSTKERLSEMLDNAQMAFLLMTPEDENALGEMEARSSVIHEVGLFQGRLGFTKAIVLLEEGCEEFSNIVGLGQIRYPRGNVKAAFEEIRQVMQREGLL